MADDEWSACVWTIEEDGLKAEFRLMQFRVFTGCSPKIGIYILYLSVVDFLPVGIYFDHEA